MNAQVITIRPLMRPTFDNTNLDTRGIWWMDNAEKLARYWTAQGNALGLDPKDDADFDFWLITQHEQEVRLQARARLPHGVSA